MLTRPESGPRAGDDLPTWEEHQEAARRIKREACLEAARCIVASEGRDGLTMGRLAEAVGCAIGTVYIYFPSKDALLEQVDARALDALRAWLEAVSETRAGTDQETASLTRLLQLARTLADPPSEHFDGVGALRHVLAVPENSHSAALHPQVLALIDFAADAIRRAQACGALAAGDARLRARVLVSTTATATALGAGNPHESEAESPVPRSGTALARALLLSWGARHRTLVGAGELLNRSLQRFEPGKEELESTGVMARSLRPWDDEGPSARGER